MKCLSAPVDPSSGPPVLSLPLPVLWLVLTCSPERQGRAKNAWLRRLLIELECSCQDGFLLRMAKQASTQLPEAEDKHDVSPQLTLCLPGWACEVGPVICTPNPT